MSELKQLTLPITGMTCANCTATIERNLKKLDGVQSAVVNLSSERATVRYDKDKLSVPEIIARVQQAGYEVATAEANLTIQRLADHRDAISLEETLAKLDGVLNAKVSIADHKANIEYIPTIHSQVDLRRAVRAAGFDAVEEGQYAIDVEAQARERGIKKQRQLVMIGLIFTIPLCLPSMGKDFSLLLEFFYQPSHDLMAQQMGGMHPAKPWFDWLLLALATPVQFSVGWQYYVGEYKALRNGSANMHALIAMGSSIAILYSLPVTFWAFFYNIVLIPSAH